MAPLTRMSTRSGSGRSEFTRSGVTLTPGEPKRSFCNGPLGECLREETRSAYGGSEADGGGCIMGIALYAVDLVPLVALAALAVHLDRKFDHRATAAQVFESDVLRDLAWLCESGENVDLLRDIAPSAGIARRHLHLWSLVSRRGRSGEVVTRPEQEG